MDYKAYNQFQYNFFTNKQRFKQYSNYEIKQFAFLLFNSLTKVSSTLVKKYMFYNDFLKFDQCPSLIVALQTKFVNGFSYAKVPKEVYFKNLKKNKSERKKRVTKSKFIIFENNIKSIIQEKLFLDSKTFEAVKNSDKVQSLGKELIINEENKLKAFITKLPKLPK